MVQMKVLVLGSGAGIPIIGHYNESVLVEVDGSSYLFDAGEPCAATMHTNALRSFYGLPRVKAPDVNIYSVKSVFISHRDADHISGLLMLLQTMHLWQKRDEEFRFHPDNKLTIYMPSEITGPFRTFLLATNLRRLRFELEILPIKEGDIYRDETAEVIAVRNTHLKEEGSYSFVLKAEGKRFAYSGDLGNELEASALLEEVTDLAIVECAHFSPESLFQALKEREGNIRKLVVSHIHPRLYGKEEEIEQLGRSLLDCALTIGRDNLEINI